MSSNQLVVEIVVTSAFILLGGVVYISDARDKSKKTEESTASAPAASSNTAPTIVTNTLEGKVLDVQDGSIGYLDYKSYGLHNYKFLFLSDKEGQIRTLVYPQAQGFLRGGNISFSYVVSSNKTFNIGEAMKKHINPNVFWVGHTVHADGVIVPDSVTYSTNYAPTISEIPTQTSLFPNL